MSQKKISQKYQMPVIIGNEIGFQTIHTFLSPCRKIKIYDYC